MIPLLNAILEGRMWGGGGFMKKEKLEKQVQGHISTGRVEHLSEQYPIIREKIALCCFITENKYSS